MTPLNLTIQVTSRIRISLVPRPHPRGWGLGTRTYAPRSRGRHMPRRESTLFDSPKVEESAELPNNRVSG